MRLLAASLFVAALLFFPGCEKASPPANKNITSWRTILVDAAQLNIGVGGSVLGESRLFSSSIDAATQTLTSYSIQNYGDLDHGSFLEVDDVSGGVEAVLAEMNGPGVITWMWSANPVGTLVFEIDGKESEFSFSSFLAGKWLPVREPYAVKTAEGHNLHFPILHQKHCRVLLRAESRAELGSLFYQIAWNKLETDKLIEAFDPEGLKKCGKELKRFAAGWFQSEVGNSTEIHQLTLMPGSWKDAGVIGGNGCIRMLEIKAGSKAELADLRIEFYWDGYEQPAISCPLFLLCGVSDRFEDVQSLPVAVDGATIYIRWPMPFGNGARVRLLNTGNSTVNGAVGFAVDFGADSSKRFCGNHTTHKNIPAEGSRRLTLMEEQGGGAIVGCMMQVANRSDGWWGEGDPIIRLNGNDKANWQGTGTEDYFGFAWCSKKEFQHPLRGQTRADPTFASMYRYHLLDALPFKAGAQFNFEAHGIGSGPMDYSTLVLWYSDTISTKD